MASTTGGPCGRPRAGRAFVVPFSLRPRVVCVLSLASRLSSVLSSPGPSPAGLGGSSRSRFLASVLCCLSPYTLGRPQRGRRHGDLSAVWCRREQTHSPAPPSVRHAAGVSWLVEEDLRRFAAMATSSSPTSCRSRCSRPPTRRSTACSTTGRRPRAPVDPGPTSGSRPAGSALRPRPARLPCSRDRRGDRRPVPARPRLRPHPDRHDRAALSPRTGWAPHRRAPARA